jgi:hypothetical protein
MQGDIATIKTEIGEINVTLAGLKPTASDTPTATSVWWILAVVIAIAVFTGIVLAVRKNKKN